jgi:peptidoglycan-N-acetylglucosamine deacetylase
MKLRSSLLLGVTLTAVVVGLAPDWITDVAYRVSPDVVFSVPTGERVVALTLDDGPSEATPEILDVLEEYGARATFFLIGEHVRARQAVARDVADAGHEIAHHMLRDEPSIRLSADEFDAQFDETRQLLDEIAGSRLFRPGSGWYDRRMRTQVEARGYRLVLGSIYPFDAQLASAAFSRWFILRNIRPGAIIVLHDGDRRGLRTAAVLRSILPELRRRGYTVTTVSALLRDAGPADPRATDSRLVQP